jgi:hypothetical protein
LLVIPFFINIGEPLSTSASVKTSMLECGSNVFKWRGKKDSVDAEDDGVNCLGILLESRFRCVVIFVLADA